MGYYPVDYKPSGLASNSRLGLGLGRLLVDFRIPGAGEIPRVLEKLAFMRVPWLVDLGRLADGDFAGFDFAPGPVNEAALPCPPLPECLETGSDLCRHGYSVRGRINRLKPDCPGLLIGDFTSPARSQNNKFI